VCQGTAADIAKAAMVTLLAMTRKDPRLAGRAAMVHMVHDEFLFEVRFDALPEVARIIKGVLESTAQLRVPMPVKLHVGRSWGELEEYVV
jgi:DNA polymerase theta